MRASRHPLFRVGAALLATAGAAWGGSLTSVTSGARPGPDILYAPPPPAPQLENRNPRFPLLGLPVTTALTDVTTDLEANQITVIVPRTVSDPHGAWRATLAAGLYDPTTGGWLRPQQNASATMSGGAGPLDLTPCGIF